MCNIFICENLVLSDSFFRLDNQTDAMLSLCEFCLGSTRNLVDASVLRHSARTIQTLESDLVPAILQVVHTNSRHSPGSPR